MTAIAEALKQAGYMPIADRLAQAAGDVAAMTPDQWSDYAGCITNAEQDRIQRRLMQVAREAIHQSKDPSGRFNWDGAKDAFYAKVRKDPDLLWELFAPYRSQASQFWLTQAAAAIRQEEKLRLVEAKRSDAGRCGSESHVSTTRVAQSPESAGGHTSDGHQEPVASRASAAAGMAAVSAVTRLSLLDTFKVNGQPIGDLTAEEANAWAGSRERDAKFVRLLTANLPPDQPIKKYRTGDDAAALMALAEKSNAE